MVQELLASLELAGVVWEDVDAGVLVVRVYVEDAAMVGVVEQQLYDTLFEWREWFDAWQPEFQKSNLAREDWAESWKRYFHTFKVSSRLVIKPSWEEYAAGSEEIVLEIDPGMSFGTGYHGTTRACLEILDELSQELGPVSFLDAGCGSGILSLAAARLGFQPITAFDHDPQAVLVARTNLAELTIGADATVVQVLAGDLDEELGLEQRFKVVVANILAVVLVKYARRVLSFLECTPDAVLILSGIMAGQYEEVKRCYEALGVREVDRRQLDEWVTGRFVWEMILSGRK